VLDLIVNDPLKAYTRGGLRATTRTYNYFQQQFKSLYDEEKAIPKELRKIPNKVVLSDINGIYKKYDENSN